MRGFDVRGSDLHGVGRRSGDRRRCGQTRLRMNRLANVKTDKVTFELMSLAVSAINGCEVCIRSHEEAVIKGGLTEEHVHDAVRVAATVVAAATARGL